MKTISRNMRSNREKGVFKDRPKVSNTPRNRLKKKRLCLKCGKKFLSKGPYNRICEKCDLANERVTASTYSVSSGSPDEISLFEEHFYELN